jgi:predicted permease
VAHPTVIATLGGLAVSLAGIELWQPAMLAIKMLGDISIPLMLFALGVRISESRIGAIRLGVIGAVARPAIGLALSFVLVWLIPLPERERALLIVFGALPPAVLNYMFAERYSQEPEKVASMVLLGNVRRCCSCRGAGDQPVAFSLRR